MKTTRRALSATLLLALASTALTAVAQNELHLGYEFDEIVVSVPFEDAEAETALPVTVLAGEDLFEDVGDSLGETLKHQIGVNSASFGPGVGQPVIRGQSARRVMVLSNSVGVTDVAAFSPDHVNAVEAILAERIEVVRGPSTLLYGSGAIGGVVNVIDNRVPESLPEETQFSIQQTSNSVNSGANTAVRLDAAAGNLAFHVSAYRRDSDNVEIKGFAIDEVAVEALEELIAEHHEEEGHDEEGHDEEEEGHEEEEVENTHGFIGNSDAEADGTTFGFSFVSDNGFIGFSVSELSNRYGLPPGAHGHHEEEGHEEEGHDEEEEGHEEEEEGHEEEGEVEFVRLNMESSRQDLRAGLDFEDGWIQSIRASLGFTDYEHSEVEFFEDGDSHVGTLFTNEGTEGRFTLTHAPMGNWSGAVGLQISSSEFSAAGEEAFIPRSDLSSTGLFLLERYNGDNLTAEFGLRLENNSVDPNGRCENETSATSLSGSVMYDLNEDSNMLVSVSRSERSPAVEELYSNIDAGTCAEFADDEDLVVHAATGLFEVGNPNLDKETSNNLEFGYRVHSGPVTGQFSAYYNQVDNYTFLELTGEEHEEVQVANWSARDASFAGFEAEVAFNVMETNNTALTLRLFGDTVAAEFDAGGNVPRIPAGKLGAELSYFAPKWSAHLQATSVGDQEDTGELELSTSGYTNLTFYTDYHFTFEGGSDLKLFVRGDNLLDEEIRNHASFLKNFAPEPGMGITVGLRFDY
tara:strand:+ start:9423 stop:11663 length:2241 start_codon:yes stop_codon:yes gene_type:complete